jgi:hypothetical protein
MKTIPDSYLDFRVEMSLDLNRDHREKINQENRIVYTQKDLEEVINLSDVRQRVHKNESSGKSRELFSWLERS